MSTRAESNLDGPSKAHWRLGGVPLDVALHAPTPSAIMFEVQDAGRPADPTGSLSPRATQRRPNC